MAQAVNRKLPRAEVGGFREAACVWSAWRPAAVCIAAREIASLCHELRLIPPACVKPFVKLGKTDMTSANANLWPPRRTFALATRLVGIGPSNPLLFGQSHFD